MSFALLNDAQDTKLNEIRALTVMSANFNNALLINIGNGYLANKLGNLTIASLCSPNLPHRRPWSNSANAVFASPNSKTNP